MTLACSRSNAAAVVYIDHAGAESFTRQQVETAAGFYGLAQNVIAVGGKRDNALVVGALSDPKAIASILSADALPGLNRQAVFAALQRKGGHSIPLLIAGITAKTDPELLRRWSAGAIIGCQTLPVEKGTVFYVATGNDVSQSLGGHQLPLEQDEARYLTLDPGQGAQWIMAAVSNGIKMPVFVRAAIGRQEVFFVTANDSTGVAVTPDPYREISVFSILAPELMFLRYAAGDRAWHSPGRFANLTIDDVWLREPYGHVNYEALLREMQLHNFHATLAFIPWNFDRSEPAVASVLRAHPERFSVCIHGNNHNHQEFGPYETHALDRQVADVKQGVARMEKFSQLTHIPYDPVMVFPHSISPQSTLAVLKRYNFLATANSLNVPSDSKAPSDSEFALRTATLAFSTFPSLRRYSAETSIPESQLAIDAFLGNPTLFYVHQGFFAAGIDSFNATADRVNEMQPSVQWCSLGYIAKHLYLEKLRDDGNYDIRTYSGTVRVENVHGRDAMFFVEKAEDFALPLAVYVDGQPYPYQRSGRNLVLQLPVHAGMGRDITIKYQNDLNPAAIDVSKPSMRINAIRHLSDFRDDVVSKTALGRWFIRSYHDNEAAWTQALLVVVLLGIGAAVGFVGRGRRRSRVRQALAPRFQATANDRIKN